MAGLASLMLTATSVMGRLRPQTRPADGFHPRFDDFIGVNDFGGSARILDQLGVSMVRPTGADWGPNARAFSWGGVQPQRGRWDWAASDAAVAAARATNHTILPILGYTALWASSVKNNPYAVAANISDWANYCSAVAERYCGSADDSGTVTHIQIWNEPAFLPDKPPVGYFSGTMQEWVEKIHLPAAEVIHAAGCKTVFGGWPSCPGCSLDLLRKTLAYKQMFRTVDVIDVHYRDLDSWSAIASWDEVMPKALWQTELGFNDAPNGLPWVYIRSLAWSLQHGKWAEPDQYRLMWYDICSGGIGDPALNKTLSWPCRPGAFNYSLTTHGQHLSLLKSLLGTPTSSTLKDFAQFQTLPVGQAAAGFTVSSAECPACGSVVIALAVDAITYVAHASIDVEFDAGTVAARGATAELLTIRKGLQRVALPLMEAKGGNAHCRVPMGVMELAAVDKAGSNHFAIAYIEVRSR